VTRQLWAGAGSVVRTGTASWEFELSQRARHIRQLKSSVATETSRGLAKETGEALGDSNRFQRLQLVVGDANILWEPAAYKFDLTSLMVLMFENGALPHVALEGNPVRVLQLVSRHGASTSVPLSDSSALRAVDIQARYLRAAVRFVDRWGLEHLQPALAYWRDVVTALAVGDEAALYGRVDWVTKRQLVQRAQERHGALSWKQAFRRDLAYHDLTQFGANLPDQLRRATDPPGLAAAVAQALATAPAGRPSLRAALMRLAREKGAQTDPDWSSFQVVSDYGPGHLKLSLPDPYLDDPAVLTLVTEYLAGGELAA
jgi:hypothetical protein